MSANGETDRPAGTASRLLLGLLAVSGVVATIMLGNWQSGRAHEKEAMQLRQENALSQRPVLFDVHTLTVTSMLYKRVEVRGRFLDQHTILLDNRLRNGVAGYEVLTPLSLDGQRAVLINRGWVRASADRSDLPRTQAPAGDLSLTGLALPVSDRYMQLSGQTISGHLWQNLDFPRYRQHTGLDLLPLVIQQQDPGVDGLDRHWPRPDLRIDTHRAYALQWYTLAAAIAIIYVIHHVRSRRRRS